MASKKFIFDESKFRPGQRIAAMLLAEREFMPKDERKTDEQIAEEAGVTRMTVYLWRTQDPNFIAYKNYLASDMMDSHLPLVYAKLIGIIKQGNAKGIEMFLKRMGDLDSKSEVTVREGASEDMTVEERKAELLKRLESASDALEGVTEGEEK